MGDTTLNRHPRKALTAKFVESIKIKGKYAHVSLRTESDKTSTTRATPRMLGRKFIGDAVATLRLRSVDLRYVLRDHSRGWRGGVVG